jgi:hypothetical protein
MPDTFTVFKLCSGTKSSMEVPCLGQLSPASPASQWGPESPCGVDRSTPISRIVLLALLFCGEKEDLRWDLESWSSESDSVSNTFKKQKDSV